MPYQTGRIAAASDIIDRALAYWDGARARRAMPRRRDLDPVEIPRLLPFVMLVDVLADPLDFRFRLIGTAVQAIMSHNDLGRRFSELPHMAKGNVIWGEYEAVVTHRRPITTVLDYVGRNRDVRGLRHCLMPLSQDDNSATMIFVAVEIDHR
jgi:hypothetical protein